MFAFQVLVDPSLYKNNHQAGQYSPEEHVYLWSSVSVPCLTVFTGGKIGSVACARDLKPEIGQTQQTW